MDKHISDLERILAATEAKFSAGQDAPALADLQALLAAIRKRDWTAVGTQRQALKTGS